MIGSEWWSTGITVAWAYSGMGQYGWTARAGYYDAGFCSDDADAGQVSTEGRLATRYAVRNGKTADTLTVVLDVMIADAARLGIVWRDPHLYYEGDGEDEEYPPPEGWRETLREQARRLGWQTYGDW